MCRLCVWLGCDRCGVAAAFYSVLSGGREEGVAQRRWRLYSGSRISLILGPFRQLQFGAGLPWAGGANGVEYVSSSGPLEMLRGSSSGPRCCPGQQTGARAVDRAPCPQAGILPQPGRV